MKHNPKKKFFIIDCKYQNPKLHYSYSEIDAIKFAKIYYGQVEVSANLADTHTVSSLSKLEVV